MVGDYDVMTYFGDSTSSKVQNFQHSLATLSQVPYKSNIEKMKSNIEKMKTEKEINMFHSLNTIITVSKSLLVFPTNISKFVVHEVFLFLLP